ncbi:hypothetical protein GUG54_03535, partial [Xanthomonas citri pv. citri]|nr:hypothetical protein [Xanthomonas citri pv. citri]
MDSVQFLILIRVYIHVLVDRVIFHPVLGVRMVGPSIHELHFDDAPSVDTVPGPRTRELLERQ